MGAYLFNRAERRNELEIAQTERQNESRIAEQRAQDALLQTYLDQMTELLLGEKLRTSAAIMQILGHSRVATTLKYGKPTEDDFRAALEEAIRIR